MWRTLVAFWCDSGEGARRAALAPFLADDALQTRVAGQLPPHAADTFRELLAHLKNWR